MVSQIRYTCVDIIIFLCGISMESIVAASLNDQETLIYNPTEAYSSYSHRTWADHGTIFTSGTVIVSLRNTCGEKPRVFAGTLRPSCYPSLEGYTECSYHSVFNLDFMYNCSSSGRYVVMIAKSSIKKLNITMTSKNYENVETIQEATYIKNTWKSDILFNVSSIPEHRYSGYIHSMTDNSSPILVSSAGKTIVAASEVGLGRVVLFSHNSYIKQYATAKMGPINANIVRWISRNVYTSASNVLTLSSASAIDWSSIASNTVVLWDGHIVLGKATVDRLITHVKGGGGLISAIKPWAYYKYTKALTDSEQVIIMKATGLLYSGYIAPQTWSTSPGDRFTANLSLAQTKHSLVHRINMCQASMSEMNSNGESVFIILSGKSAHIENYWRSQFAAVLQNLVNKYYSFAESLVPCKRKSLTQSNDVRFLLTYGEFIRSQLLAYSGIKAPGVNLNPGDFKTPRTEIVRKLNIAPQIKDEYHPTGLYLPAGNTLYVKSIENKENAKNFRLSIGAHSWSIYKRKTSYQRWARTYVHSKYDLSALGVYSPFGGQIWIRNKEVKPVVLEFRHVVESPLFDLRNGNSSGNWNTRRNAPGLWADIVGDMVMFTLPSSAIRSLDASTISSALTMYDNCVKHYHNLRGTNWRTGQRQIVGTDVQLWAGYMHAGYPIAAHLDIAVSSNTKSFIFNPSDMSVNGRWGLAHEIGHNFQRSAWTFDGTRQVTNNIYTLRCQQVMSRYDPYSFESGKMSKRKTRIVNYFNAVDFNVWKRDPFMALTVYAQLYNSFGWELYRKVFRAYEEMTNDEKPSNDDQKRDSWLIQTSQAANYNLSPIFDLWGIPVSPSAKLAVSSLTPYLPDDIVTQLNDARSRSIAANYSFTTRSVAKLTETIGPQADFLPYRQTTTW